MRAENVRALFVGVDRVRLGSQAFYDAYAFNANIGAWNIARVTSLDSVCAAFGPGGAPPQRDALVRLGSQAFRYASVFNTDIGAWNTARVTSLSAV